MAIHNLGTLYFNGQGTEKNIDKAWECYIRAASFGSYLSSSNLSKMQINGDRGKKDILKAISWSLVAIEQGSNEAIEDISTFKKDLTKDDHHQIIENLKFLSENGFPWAFLALHRIYLYGTFSEINLDLAKEFKEKAEKAEIKKQDYFSIQN
jgi:TPR repeat protein